MYKYKAKILNVVDGDTFDVDIDIGFRIHLKERIRLLDIDTPEKRGDAEKALGLLVTKFATQYEGKEVVIQTEKQDSFGRWLAKLWFENGVDIATIYNNLGINKLCENYSEENVWKLQV